MFKTIFKVCFYLPVAIIGAFMAWCVVGFVFAGIMTGIMMPTPTAKPVVKTAVTLPTRSAHR